MSEKQKAISFDDLVTIERAKNSVANGRAACAMLFLLVLFIAAQIDEDALWLAFFPILSVGAAYIADRTERFQVALSLAAVVFGVVPFLSILYI